MIIDFSAIHNHYEQAVYDKVLELAPNYPSLSSDLAADAACIALNRLKPQYVRHNLDFNFYLADSERTANEAAVHAAVESALQWVESQRSLPGRATR